MHFVQSHILKKLSLSPKARYADLKPQSIESNLFSYHLKTLMKEGLISGNQEKYSLTSKGKSFVDRVSFETFRERIQPKIVTLLVLENNKGEYLLYKRKRAPFIDHIGFPYGKIHMEERIEEAAERELEEKAGLKGDLKHRGEVYISVYDETELISHMLCHVFTTKKYSGTLKTDTTIGQCFWGKIEHIPPKDLIPGVKQVIQLLKKNKTLFFAEYFLNVYED